ncbi:hypothetical protein EDB83DRAFT_2507597 [Lactarius deliciosus]|nr:hypothetical protein EDB83DRAFT_2507597 [Lactarius deliciosus]
MQVFNGVGGAAAFVVKNRQQNTSVATWRYPEEIYASTLPSWRAAFRRQSVAVVERECETIAQLCYALAFGVYISSYLKDLVCSPRPYASSVNPVGNHHLEYGLPPTHSTGSTFMALFLGAHVHDLHRLGSLSTTAFAKWVVVLFVYVLSIVVGRLYTGVHGFMDFRRDHTRDNQLVATTPRDARGRKWVQSSDWGDALSSSCHIHSHFLVAPLVVNVVCLLLINQHPSPVDDCPCFEDAIAFASVILGIITSFWCSKRVPALNTNLFTSVNPGAALYSPAAITTWVLFALVKLVTGVLIIFSWRILAKPSVQTLLPPLFRWLAWASPLRLPNRIIDLDLAVAEVVDEDAGVASGRRVRSSGMVKRRWSPSGSVQEKAITFEEANEGGTEEDGEAKHYDADVLTKVVVYVGIGAIATVMVPALFEALEWGV